MSAPASPDRRRRQGPETNHADELPPRLAATRSTHQSTEPLPQGCRCNDIARRLELLVAWLGIDLDVIDARDAFDKANGDVDVDVWITAVQRVERNRPSSLNNPGPIRGDECLFGYLR
jgi:hypothetical protein